MLKWMISEGYGDARTMKRRIAAMEAWLENPVLMEADKEAEYHTTFDIDLATITEPVLCCPNDPDDAKTLSEVAGRKIDEVFIGSCMTNIGHFRAAGELLKAHDGQLPTRLWISPPTKMDEAQLIAEGFYSVYGKVGARTEMPGCSLCMGNQARVAEKSTVVSTSTRNFPNRLGQGADVFLSSAELAAVAAIMGKLPTKEEYLEMYHSLSSKKESTYQYLSFDQLDSFTDSAKAVDIDPETLAEAKKSYATFIS
jgi:aconitate hydratase 2/2-methylisocitrate dehydratase